MQYYHYALKELFVSHGIEVRILSNYHTDEHGQYLPNIFKYKGRILRMMAFFRLLIKIVFAKVSHPGYGFVYLSFGTYLDAINIFTLSLFSKVNVDLHEFCYLDSSSSRLIKLFEYLYRKRVDVIWVHSESNKKKLEKLEMAHKMLFVPHIKYTRVFTGADKPTEASNEVKEAIVHDAVNILYFGTIRESKGVQNLYKLLESLEQIENAKRVNIIVAGEDIFDLGVEQSLKKYAGRVSTIIRRIEDEELAYLFEKCAYVLMPYTKVSQSGVLEMAFFYRKPIITSNLPYFLEVLQKCPSFGAALDFESNTLARDFFTAIDDDASKIYYTKQDVDIYQNKESFQVFVKDLKDKFDLD